ncbi:MAG: glucose-6-phosphate isomerase [Actinobacteria bacterium]|nr:MAG: glucose-6-phosphate isomerase [Actinomycetota bacterium]
MGPFASRINFNTGVLEQYDAKVVRKLSDMASMFANDQAYKQAVSAEDELVYEVFEKHVPEEEGQLAHAVTVIYPGKIGDEYFMTKGHFHTKPNTAELYLCIKGRGGIIMSNEQGKVSYLEMVPGSMVYVAPYWSHRTVNTSDEEFAFLAIYPADAGHDYGSIEQTGFPKLVIDKNGKTELIDNPKWNKS